MRWNTNVYLSSRIRRYRTWINILGEFPSDCCTIGESQLLWIFCCSCIRPLRDSWSWIIPEWLDLLVRQRSSVAGQEVIDLLHAWHPWRYRPLIGRLQRYHAYRGMKQGCYVIIGSMELFYRSRYPDPNGKICPINLTCFVSSATRATPETQLISSFWTGQ